MGATGDAVLTVRRARRLGGLLASERWFISDGDGATLLLSVRRHAPSASSKNALAHVTPLPDAASGGGAGAAAAEAGYAAEVRRKEAVGCSWRGQIRQMGSRQSGQRSSKLATFRSLSRSCRCCRQDTTLSALKVSCCSMKNIEPDVSFDAVPRPDVVMEFKVHSKCLRFPGAFRVLEPAVVDWNLMVDQVSLYGYKGKAELYYLRPGFDKTDGLVLIEGPAEIDQMMQDLQGRTKCDLYILNDDSSSDDTSDGCYQQKHPSFEDEGCSKRVKMD